MKTTKYRDFYGCTAYLTEQPDGTVRLTVYMGLDRFIDKAYNTVRGAKIALGRYSDGWYEVNM